jgi:hypothetical protein
VVLAAPVFLGKEIDFLLLSDQFDELSDKWMNALEWIRTKKSVHFRGAFMGIEMTGNLV